MSKRVRTQSSGFEPNYKSSTKKSYKQDWAVKSKAKAGDLRSLDMPAVAGSANLYQAEFTHTGTFQLINAPKVGANYYQRMGNSTKGHSVHIKGRIVAEPYMLDGAAAVYASKCVGLRLLLVYCSDAMSGAPTVTDIIQQVDLNAAATTNQIDGGMNMQKTSSYRILRDKKWIVNINGTTPADAMDALSRDPEYFQIDEYVKLKGAETLFKAATGGVGAWADIQAGGLFLVLLTDSGPSTVITSGDLDAGGVKGFMLRGQCRYKWREE